jgi:hypothetical protein
MSAVSSHPDDFEVTLSPAQGVDSVIVQRAEGVDMDLTGGTVDVDVEIEVARVTSVDVLTVGGPAVSDVSTARFQITDVAVGVPGPPGEPGPAGPPGPPGPPGSGGGGTTGATFEQSFVLAATDWVVTHNLGTRFVEVNCFAPNGIDEIDAEVDILDENVVVVRWYYPTTGLVRILG